MAMTLTLTVFRIPSIQCLTLQDPGTGSQIHSRRSTSVAGTITQSICPQTDVKGDWHAVLSLLAALSLEGMTALGA